MFGDEFQAAGSRSEKNKLGLLEKKSAGICHVVLYYGWVVHIAFGSILMGVVGGTFYGRRRFILQSWSAGLCFLWGCVL